MNRQIVVHYLKCTGCRLCEMACSIREKTLFNLAYSRIKVYSFFPSIEIPTLCWRCEDAPCVQKCPEGGLEREDSGVIRLDRELCNGCGICKEACPVGGVFFAPDGYPLICDLCGGSQKPQCVEICPSGALEYRSTLSNQKRHVVSPEEMAEEIRKQIWGEEN